MPNEKTNLYRDLAKIQQKLKAPKNQRNNFGKYQYRSCEDILEGVKPLLGDLILMISDELVLIGDRYYIKSTASISDGAITVSSSGFAREAETKKGMDVSQVTGASSSYARKYALNGLLCIDDTKDADHGGNQSPTKQASTSTGARSQLNSAIEKYKVAPAVISKGVEWATNGRTSNLLELSDGESETLLNRLEEKFSNGGE